MAKKAPATKKATTRSSRSRPTGTPAPITKPSADNPVVIDGVPSTSAPTSVARIRVAATQDGYYDDRYLRPGDIFDVHPDHFSEKWMEHTRPNARKRITSSNESLDRERRETMRQRAASSTLASHTQEGLEADIDNPPGLDVLGAGDEGGD